MSSLQTFFQGKQGLLTAVRKWRFQRPKIGCFMVTGKKGLTRTSACMLLLYECRLCLLQEPRSPPPKRGPSTPILDSYLSSPCWMTASPPVICQTMNRCRLFCYPLAAPDTLGPGRAKTYHFTYSTVHVQKSCGVLGRDCIHRKTWCMEPYPG